MDCERFRDILLTDYRDNELSAQKKAEFETHLRGCESCRLIQESLGRAIPGGESGRGLIVHPPKEVWTRIVAQIDASGTGPQEAQVVRDWVRGLLTALKPAWSIPVLAAVFALMIVVRPAPHVQTVSEVTPFTSDLLLSSEVDSDEGFGTAIENAFM